MGKEPTIEDYGRRLRRLLHEVHTEHLIENGALRERSRRTGRSSHTDRKFILEMRRAAIAHLISGMEMALSEMLRTFEVTQLDPAAVRAETEAAIEGLLGSISFVASRPDGPVVPRETLEPLVPAVLSEFDCGLYRLPGDPTPEVTINIANVHGSTIGSMQQLGAASSLGSGGGE